MTDLLRPLARSSPPARGGRTRSPATSAVLGALGAAGAVLLLTSGLALAGWFGADAGRHGETTDAVRVGADAWLLALGAGLELDGASLTVPPLLLTGLVCYAAYRSGRWVVHRTGAADLRAALAVLLVMTPVHAGLALVVAVLAGHPAAEPSLRSAFAGGAVVMLGAGGAGVCAGAGLVRPLLGLLPTWAATSLRSAAAMVLAMFAAGTALLGAALVVDLGAAATVLSRLHLDGPAGLLYTLVGASFVPNAALLAGAYLLGPGFLVGTATIVSPSAVVLGPVPAVPLLAALPADGATPAWAPWLVGVPVLVAAGAVLLAGRGRSATGRYDAGAARGLLAGLLAAVGFTILAVLAGGSAGPGRMADVGVRGTDVLLAATVAFGGGGLLGGSAATFAHRSRLRRRSTADTAAD